MSGEAEEEIVELSTQMADTEIEPATIDAAQMSALEQSREAKARGNVCFGEQDYENAIEHYTEAIELCPEEDEREAAPYYCNRAACHIKLEQYEDCLKDASKAIELQDDYFKAYARRATANEKLEHYESALEDYKMVLKFDPKNARALQAVQRLPPLVEEQREKLKNEMMGKLKDLGNLCLRPFGLSTDNFQMVQDPNSGSYSVNFVQGQQRGAAAAAAATGAHKRDGGAADASEQQ